MLYIIQDQQRLDNCITHLRSLNIAGKPWQVEIKPYAKKRSEAQNRTMWSFLNCMAEHTGHDAENLHEIFKARFLGSKTITALGDIVVMPRSTTELSTKEFGDYLRKIEAVAVTMGIRLPLPDDYKYLTDFGRSPDPKTLTARPDSPVDRTPYGDDVVTEGQP